MQKALNRLKKRVAKLSDPTPLSKEKLEQMAKNCQVALMAGGESSRFREVVGTQQVNKNAYKLPNGETMIERAIKMYRDAGITNFVALVYHAAKSIENVLGDGEKVGVHIKYSYDPEKPVGKGGAIRHALDNGSIDPQKTLIVHNPDDVIVQGMENQFVPKILSGYAEGQKRNMLATIVVVEETPYPFTGMKIMKNQVEAIEMYPMIPIPTHIGVTVFSPKVFEYFPKLFDLNKKTDFEKVLFPILAREKKLHAVRIPSDAWIAVNNLKAYKKFIKYLEESGELRNKA